MKNDFLGIDCSTKRFLESTISGDVSGCLREWKSSFWFEPSFHFPQHREFQFECEAKLREREIGAKSTSNGTTSSPGHLYREFYV